MTVENKKLEKELKFRTLRINLDRYHSVQEYLQAFETNGVQLSGWAESIIKEIQLSGEIRDLNIILVSCRDLLLHGPMFFKDIVKFADEQGWKPMSHEAVLALSLAYIDQPVNEKCIVVTEPLVVKIRSTLKLDPNYLSFQLFLYKSEDGRWLCADYDIDGPWDPIEDEVVFAFMKD